MAQHHIDVHDVTDATWSRVEADLAFDPYCTRGFRAATARALGGRPVLLHATGDGWEGWYVLDLLDRGAGRVLARTPEYGGPWLVTDARVSVAAAASDLRRRLDDELRSMGVVSEVALLSAWLPHREVIAHAWGAEPDKDLCLLDLGALDERWRHLSKGRRSDIARARRESEVRWRALDATSATAFSSIYGDAMEVKGAAERWRLGADYFVALAEERAVDVMLAEVQGEAGIAKGLFLRNGDRAAYIYAARQGEVSGGPSAVVWTAAERLAVTGVRELLLGGGLAPGDDDPLYRFKRSFASRTTPLQLAARVFDALRHEELVTEGRARPLPPNAVSASDC